MTFEPSARAPLHLRPVDRGNPGPDPFGEPTRRPSPPQIVHKLAELGAYGVNLHDNDLVPRDASRRRARPDRARVPEGARRDRDEGPDGDDEPVRRPGVPRRRVHERTTRRFARYALQKTMRAMDLGEELGAETYVFWGGREGAETNASKDPQEAMKWFRDAINFLCEYSIAQGYDLQVRARAQAERAARRHLPADDRPRARVHLHARPSGDGRPQPGGRARHDGRARTSRTASRRRWRRGSCSTSTSTRRSRAATTRTSASAANPKAAFFLVKLLEDVGLRGHAALRRHAYRTGRRGRVGLRARQHAHLSDPQGEGGAATRTRRSRRCVAAARRRRRIDGAVPRPVLAPSARRRSGELDARSPRPGRARSALRAARPAHDRPVARRSVTIEAPRAGPPGGPRT